MMRFDALKEQNNYIPMNHSTKKLSQGQQQILLRILSERFEKHMHRHAGVEWSEVQSRLESYPGKLWTLQQMEETGGEPDVIGCDAKTGEYVFCDCSVQSPLGRRSFCYDQQALDSRKEFKPKDSAEGMAAAIGIELLTEEEYRGLQRLGEYDTKTSSWLKTPAEIRNLGGAIFADRRYNHVFVYHNGAESYYAGRGFRGVLKV